MPPVGWCLNTWFSAGSAVIGYGTFRRQGLMGGNGRQAYNPEICFLVHWSPAIPATCFHSHDLCYSFPTTMATPSKTTSPNKSFVPQRILSGQLRKVKHGSWTVLELGCRNSLVGKMHWLYNPDDLCSYPHNPHKSWRQQHKRLKSQQAIGERWLSPIGWGRTISRAHGPISLAYPVKG